jgi:hypothetical protein
MRWCIISEKSAFLGRFSSPRAADLPAQTRVFAPVGQMARFPGRSAPGKWVFRQSRWVASTNMKTESLNLDDIVQLLKSAHADLCSAEFSLSQIADLPNLNSEESQALEELLHQATHELGGSLGFYINDIETLISRQQIRSSFAQYSNEQFNQIAQQGWSLGLVRELHDAIPSISLEDHSSAIRAIISQLSALPKIAHSRFSHLTSRSTSG